VKLKTIALLTAIATTICSCAIEQSRESNYEDVACSAEVQAANGLISMTFGDPCRIELKDGDVRIGVQSSGSVEWKQGLEYPDIEVEPGIRRTKVTYRGLPNFPTLELDISSNGNKLLINTKVCNPHSTEITIYGLEVPSFAHEFGGSTNLGNEVILLQNGYSSWSFSWVLKKRVGDPLLPKCNGTICDHGNNISLNDISGISFWNATVAPEPSGPGLSVGAVSAKHLKLRIAVEHRIYGGPDIRLVAGATGDAVTIEPDECYSIDPIALVANADPLLSALEYAGLVAEHNPPPAIPPKFANPAGWSSWYCLFERVTEQDILDHAQILAQEGFRDAGYKILQLDDGYEVAFGDWRINEKFPRGLAPLASDIKSYGLIPGIWVAPFAFDSDIDIIKDHPEWFVHDRTTGGIYIYDDPLAQPRCALDVTHPEAASWLHQTMRSFKDAGFEYFKLDFLFFGAVEGLRFEDVTSLEAFDRGLEIIKEALGGDVFILACGQPFLPTAGFAHAARTSSDVTYGFMGKPNFGLLKLNSLISAARFYSALWQLPDPDNFLLRAPYDAHERTTSLAADALFGRIHILGDDMRTLDDETKQMILNPKLVEISMSPGLMIPVDLFYKAVDRPKKSAALEMFLGRKEIPSLWLKKGAGKQWLGVINWWDESTSVEVTPAHVGTDGAVLRDVLTFEEIALPTSLYLSERQGRIFEVEINF